MAVNITYKKERDPDIMCVVMEERKYKLKINTHTQSEHDSDSSVTEDPVKHNTGRQST